MKKFKQLDLRLRLNKFLFLLSMMIFTKNAEASGLVKAKGVLESFRDELLTIAPIIAVISLILLGIGYAARVVEKENIWRWAFGIIVVGSAPQLTKMFFG